LKKLVGVFAAVVLSLSNLALPAAAAPTLVSNTMTLGLSGDGQTLIRAGAVNISGAGSMISKTFACPSAQSARTSLVAGFITGCTELFNTGGAGSFSGTDLATATVQTGQNTYSPYDISRGAHIVTTTYVIDTGYEYHIHPASVQATAPVPTVQVQPTVTLSGSTITATSGIWSNGTVNLSLWLCPNTVVAKPTVSNMGLPASCGLLYAAAQGNSLPTNLLSSYVQTMSGRSPYDASLGTHVVAQSSITGFVVYSASANYGSSNSQSNGSSADSSQPKYSGPEFSSFGAATLAGNKLVTSGKKLDSITSMKINGKAVTYKINSASELEIDLPKDLAPGKYDVEINSSHGKLTHLQGITIKAVVPTKESAFKAEGAWFNYGSLLELTNIAKKIGSEYTSVKCIVNAADPVVAERLAKRACSYIEANRLRGKAVTYESKSTFKGDGFWVRVVANG
jgi:hypothetical protein